MKIRVKGRSQANHLDKEFESILFPLNLMQMVMLQPKYRILDGVITRNGFFYNFICSLGMILVICIHLGKIFLAAKPDIQSDFAKLMHKADIFDSAYYISSILLICIFNMADGNNNVELIIKMQKVYRLLHCQSVTMFRNFNWFLVSFVFFTYIFFCISYATVGKILVFHTLSTFTLLNFDANIIYAARTIKFLTLELRQWRLEMEEFLVETCLETNHEKLTKYLTSVSERGKQLYNGYMDILEAFKLSGKLYQKTVFLYVTEIFVHTLFCTQVLLTVRLDDFIDFDFSFVCLGFLMCLWAVKNIVLLSYLCAACQQFYLAITEVQMTCAIIRSEGCHLEDARRLCNKVSRMSASWNTTHGMRAGGVLDVNATLPPRLLLELANYTIVLLQFTFL